jgi:hypothetical protein
VALALASLAAAIAWRDAAPIFGCAAASALLLVLLNNLGSMLGNDRRTALADLVLLTPIIPLVMAS